MPLAGFLLLFALLSLTPEQRSLRARIAAHEKWAKTSDRSAATAAARKAAADRWERQVDPDNRLSPQERAQRAESAKRAYFSRLALKSSRARSRARELTAEAEAAESELAALADARIASTSDGGADG